MTSSTTTVPKLYCFPGNISSALAPHIVFSWTNQQPQKDFELLPPADDYKTNINPAGGVPALLLPSGRVITQVTAILYYIAKQSGDESLLGGDSLEDQAEVLKWSVFAAADMHSSFWTQFFTHRYSGSNDEKDLKRTKDAGMKVIEGKYDVLEKHLAAVANDGRTYLVTDRKTLADAHIFIVLSFGTVVGVDIEKYPNIKAYYECMKTDEGAKKAFDEHGVTKHFG